MKSKKGTRKNPYEQCSSATSCLQKKVKLNEEIEFSSKVERIKRQAEIEPVALNTHKHLSTEINVLPHVIVKELFKSEIRKGSQLWMVHDPSITEDEEELYKTDERWLSTSEVTHLFKLKLHDLLPSVKFRFDASKNYFYWEPAGVRALATYVRKCNQKLYTKIEFPS